MTVIGWSKERRRRVRTLAARGLLRRLLCGLQQGGYWDDLLRTLLSQPLSGGPGRGGRMHGALLQLCWLCLSEGTKLWFFFRPALGSQRESFCRLNLQPNWGKEHAGDGNNNTSECLLLFAFSQGIQNGITRRCQTLPICTTHCTGYLTDVGRLLGWCVHDGVAGEKFLKARGAKIRCSCFFQSPTKTDALRIRFFFHDLPHHPEVGLVVSKDAFLRRQNQQPPRPIPLFSGRPCFLRRASSASAAWLQGAARILQRAGSSHRSCPDGRCRRWPAPCDQEQDRLKRPRRMWSFLHAVVSEIRWLGVSLSF